MANALEICEAENGYIVTELSGEEGTVGDKLFIFLNFTQMLLYIGQHFNQNSATNNLTHCQNESDKDPA